MLTPSYSLTANERIIPRLALNFTSAALDPRVTVTRSLNTATVTNADGSISIVNANLPRFDYAGGICNGLLIEETRTNLFLNSVLANAVAGAPGTPPTSWANSFTTGSISNVAAANYAAGYAISIACSTSRRGLAQTISVSANTTYIMSANVRRLSGSVTIFSIFDAINLPAGASITGYQLNNVAVAGSTSIPTTNSFIAMILSVGATAGTALFRFGVGMNLNATGEVEFSNLQLEMGAYASSYIPTTTTTLQRNADVVAMTGANFSSWWQSTTGAAVVCAQQKLAAGVKPWLQFDDTTANNVISFRGNTTTPELYIRTTTDQAQIAVGTIAANITYGLSGAWDTNNCAAAINGNPAFTDTTVVIPTVTQARLGNDGTNYLNGWLKSIKYWPQRITDAETQAFSKL